MDFMQLVSNTLKKLNVKQDDKVVELYLGKSKLEFVNSLSKYRFLLRLYLNSNKLRSLLCPMTNQSFLKNNYRITELYLQNNDLSDISGTLSHLRNLQVLMLQKNQLPDLNGTLQEIKSLLALRFLNLFDNPLAQESGYRILVIYTLPQVTVLDRQEVTASEKKKGREVHDAEREAIQASIGFGRRTFINPSLLHTLCKPPKKYYPPPSSRSSPEKKIPPGKTSRSVMQYTAFDWSRVPNSQQRRLGEAVPAPQNLTVTIR